MSAAGDDRFRRNEHVVTREILGETLLVPISADVADMDNIFALNDTGAFVWHRLDGALSVAGICAALIDAFEVSEEQARDDVHALVDDLRRSGLVDKVE